MTLWIEEYGRVLISVILGVFLITVAAFMWEYIGSFLAYLGDSLMGGNA